MLIRQVRNLRMNTATGFLYVTEIGLRTLNVRVEILEGPHLLVCVARRPSAQRRARFAGIHRLLQRSV